MVEDGWEKSLQSGTAYAIQLEGQELKVLSDICTHLGCRVNWREDQQKFACPCHDAFFGIEGQVISGPPPRPMIALTHRVENGQLQIKLEA